MRKASRSALSQDLARLLDEQYDAFNVADAAADPVQFLRRFDVPADREIVAFVAAGLRPEAIHHVDDCTRCRADLYHSYRRDGAAAGRMMSFVGFAGP